ncbi:hypothetical protein GCM10011575_14930 [Microlunatus endophyticus]|uniref:Alpha/beta hydrolase family protein n=1 Tax=Microlunatus endophyticus TaxID=1716077 RepID=A0A917S4N7_9ACTN|nr:hypothetical protein GCM10011575_14930 [Microlunatus endophyticus]
MAELRSFGATWCLPHATDHRTRLVTTYAARTERSQPPNSACHDLRADVPNRAHQADFRKRVLDRYRDRGGDVTEHVWDGVGHSPHLERVEEFAAIVESLRSQP